MVHEHRNYDARITEGAGERRAPGEEQRRALDLLKARVPGLSVVFDARFGTSRSLYNRTGYLGEARPGLSAREIALDFVAAHRAAFGLSASDLEGAELTDSVFSKTTGATHLYLRQSHLGLPVYNGQLHVNVNREGRVLSLNNAFFPELARASPSPVPALSAEAAVFRAVEHLDLGIDGLPRALGDPSGPRRLTSIDPAGLSLEPAEAGLMWLPIRAGRVRLVWQFVLFTLDGAHAYDFTVDAASGEVWTRFDWANGAQYRVYPAPTESPNHTTPAPPGDGRMLVVDPALANASPLGWHDTGSASYSGFRGNNAHAYEDSDGNSSPPSLEPDCGASLDCDFPMDLTQAPGTYVDAAVANLFYWNNWIHDVQYQYGFDEAAGNFQVSNFGNGGLGGDDIRAEAQDGGGYNNANFLTPADGSRPRMQMYLWNLTSPERDGDLDAGIVVHEYGHGISIRQVGGPSNSSCLNNNQQPGEGWSDWFALAYTAKAGDQGSDRRGVGTYSLGQPTNGNGIRTQAYSTDPAINTHTYASINGMSIPHGVGEVWAQGLWEVYWALVDVHGFDPDLANASAGAGNHRAMLYVNEGLKNTTCSPTFTDARDGIIQAAVDNYGGEDVCLLWQAFADFGLGVDAVSGDPYSTAPVNGFEIPVECQCSPAPVVDAGPDLAICAGESALIGTPAQGTNSYSWSPGGENTAQISVSPAVTTTYTVTATTSCGSKSDSVTVHVDDGTAAGLDEDFEGGAEGWALDGLWHRTASSDCAVPGYSSPIHAMYYGLDSSCTYSTGARTLGELTSPMISGVTAASTLEFDYYRVVESYAGSYDRTEVAVVADGIETLVFALDSSYSSVATWLASGPIDLSSFAGQMIQIRFRFDSIDGAANSFPGWFIDNVRVTGTSVCGGGPTNTPPDVVIESPSAGLAFVEGTPVPFAGTAADLEDGDLTAAMTWESDLDGYLGLGGSVTRVLSVGTHIVTASVTDSGGMTSADMIALTVNPNTAPVVTIYEPTDGAVFGEGEIVTFSGQAFDDEEGDLTHLLVWTSDMDGIVGRGGYFTAPLSAGSHVIIAAASDAQGAEGAAVVNVTVNSAGGPVAMIFDSQPSEDGWIRESSEGSGVGGTSRANNSSSRALMVGDHRHDRQWRSVLSFDTSAIPDGATILSATLRLRRGSSSGSNPFESGFGACFIDVQTGAFGGNASLSSSDFQASATAPRAGTLGNAPVNGSLSEGSLDTSGLAAINKAGTTQMRIYFELPDNDNRSHDYIGYYSGEQADPYYRPHLEVVYEE